MNKTDYYCLQTLFFPIYKKRQILIDICYKFIDDKMLRNEMIVDFRNHNDSEINYIYNSIILNLVDVI